MKVYGNENLQQCFRNTDIYSMATGGQKCKMDQINTLRKGKLPMTMVMRN